MSETTLRQAWLAALAHAPRDLLRSHVERCIDETTKRDFEWLRMPETGLAMVRARIGGSGDRFNVGETTLTRCVVRHRDARGHAVAGIGYVKGRDPDRARWIAMLDALLQQGDHHARLMTDVIAPLQVATAAQRAADDAATATSRVHFFTLEAGDA